MDTFLLEQVGFWQSLVVANYEQWFKNGSHPKWAADMNNKVGGNGNRNYPGGRSEVKVEFSVQTFEKAGRW